MRRIMTLSGLNIEVPQTATHLPIYPQEKNRRKLLLTALFGFALGIVPAHAEVVIKLRPPISIREHRTVRPGPRHVWVSGYHRWDGNAYAWEKGRWEEPPRAHVHWHT